MRNLLNSSLFLFFPPPPLGLDSRTLYNTGDSSGAESAVYCLSSGESHIHAASVFTLLFMKSAPWVINHLSLNVLIVQRASWLSETWAPCVRVCCPTCESSLLPSFLPASTLNSRLLSPCSSSSSQQVGLNTSFSQQQLGKQFLLFSPLDLSTLIKPLSMC